MSRVRRCQYSVVTLNPPLTQLASPALTLHPRSDQVEPHLQRALAAAADDPDEAERLAASLFRQGVSFAFLCLPVARTPTALLSAAAAAPTLQVRLPPGYPAEACSCWLSSHGSLGREAAAAVQAGAQDIAAAAAKQASPCLTDLLEYVSRAAAEEEQQHRAQSRGPGDSGSATSSCANGGGSDAAAARRQKQALLLLDHMHDRAGYSRTIKSWCKELGISGALIFQGGGPGGCSPLILVLLRGSPADVDEYLRRQRTETVDVDSRGRKCKERMMRVLVEQTTASVQGGAVACSVSAQDATPDGSSGGAGARTRAVAGTGQAPPREGFREICVDSLTEVSSLLLREAGMLEHEWKPPLGLTAARAKPGS